MYQTINLDVDRAQSHIGSEPQEQKGRFMRISSAIVGVTGVTFMLIATILATQCYNSGSCDDSVEDTSSSMSSSSEGDCYSCPQAKMIAGTVLMALGGVGATIGACIWGPSCAERSRTDSYYIPV